MAEAKATSNMQAKPMDVEQDVRVGDWSRTATSLRVVAWVFSVIALVLVATDRQTTHIPVALPGLTTPLYLTKTAFFTNIKALTFYVGSLAVVVTYSFLQTIFSAVSVLHNNGVGHSKPHALFTFVADQTVAYLLASATAVATEIGYLAKEGANGVGWGEVCSQLHHFCLVYGFSVINAYLAALAIFASAAISAYHLFRHYSPTATLTYEAKQTDI